MSCPEAINVVDVIDLVDESILEVEGEVIAYEDEYDRFQESIENKMICCISLLIIGTIIVVFVYMKG